ncbi:MAG: hypothetical protein ACI37P_07895 [Eggerthellaceae bacterium]
MSHATTSSAETAALSAASAAQPAPTSATAATSVPKPTLHAADPTVRSLLLKGNFGLEKETLRIDHDGFMAQTPNPFPGHPHITRDFCENQVEINTGIHPTYQGVLAELNEHNTTIQRTLAEADEYLWPFSNPPYLRNERDVPVAQFTGELAHKTVYREYLSDRYGRYKMTFCGIHFNYSFADELLQADFALSDYQDFATYKNDLYVKLAELAVAYGWVMVAATAASPLNDGSYVERTGLGQDLYLGLSTVRVSELGYWNFFAPVLSYESKNAYVDSMQSYIDQGLIKYPSELYYPIRLKPRGENTLPALRDGDVSHIELRMFDLNPLVPQGIDERDVLFGQLFLVWLASMPPLHLTEVDQVQAIQNFKNAAHYDLKTVNIIMPGKESISGDRAALQVISQMQEFFAGYSPEVEACLAFQRDKFVDLENRYAWAVRSRYSNGFVQKGLDLCRKQQALYVKSSEQES